MRAYRQIVLSALLLVLLVTQAGSSICGAQCIQHAVPNVATHSCHEMEPPHGPALETCSMAVHALCAIDLLENNQSKPLLMERAVLLLATEPYAMTTALFAPPYHAIRSSSSPPPLIGPLRV